MNKISNLGEAKKANVYSYDLEELAEKVPARKVIKIPFIKSKEKQAILDEEIYKKHIVQGLTDVLLGQSKQQQRAKKIQRRGSKFALSELERKRRLNSFKLTPINNLISPNMPKELPIETNNEQEIIDGFRLGDRVKYEGREYVIDKFSDNKKAILIKIGGQPSNDIRVSIKKLEKMAQPGARIIKPGEAGSKKAERRNIDTKFKKGQKVMLGDMTYFFEGAYETPSKKQYAILENKAGELTVLLDRITDFRKPEKEKEIEIPQEVKKEKYRGKVQDKGINQVAGAYEDLESALEFGGVNYSELKVPEKGKTAIEKLQEQLRKNKSELKTFEDRFRFLESIASSADKMEKEYGANAQKKLDQEIAQIEISRGKILKSINLLQKQIKDEKDWQVTKKELAAKENIKKVKDYEAVKKQEKIEDLKAKIAKMTGELESLGGSKAEKLDEDIGVPEEDIGIPEADDIGEPENIDIGRPEFAEENEIKNNLALAKAHKKELEEQIEYLQGLYDKMRFFERIKPQNLFMGSELRKLKKSVQTITDYIVKTSKEL